ncbi:putative membrane-bound spermidine synthase [Acidovorax soli]|uniref:Putative membrane-bound spermidine synthase n=1 Tax=Acidovorax soli TaxID=592050 RepID=A0A7X0P9Y3_9BURK|nr:fused MFS/spermidine synthase [Acidovorax soli]MBB6558025.1 putative membrane-bound spermidine synthase [Acidovorax soli]
MTPSHRSPRHWLLAIFILSGFAGLIYQSIWSHYLGLFLGHAAYAQALVLAIFMGGMAAGAAWIARAGQRWRNLIRGYALIEAIIGALGLLFHWIFTNVAAFSYDWLIPSLGTPWAINLSRWIVAALLILPQTILLGMTFPLMSGGLIRRFPGSDGNLLGGLYFTNSIGAAFGALMAVFVLLPWVGLPGAMVVAGILNFVVAALAWWLARDPEPVAPAPVSIQAAPDQRLRNNPLLRTVLFGTALSGAASFAYEIIWIRMLSMAVGSTMHAFELMLASFIAGIALGGLWVRKHADSAESPLRLVGWMQVFMGIAALASLAVYANAFTWVGWLMSALTKTDGGYSLFNLGTAATAISIMLPAAFFAGTTLPLFTVALLRSGQGERAIGRVYAWNTLGAIAGVFAAIHFLIPNLGLKLALCIAALVDIGLGLFLLRQQVDSKRTLMRFGIAVGLSAVAVIVAVRIPFDLMVATSGVYRHGRASLKADDQIVYYKDGKTATVAAAASRNGSIHISTNGKTDASIQMQDHLPATQDEPTMVLAAALPLGMVENPKRVGVIGFGSGLTTHAFLGDERLERVDTIDIEEAMVEGAKAFGVRSERAYKDPRSHVIIDDAKSYFSGQNQKYDIIISEPSNPWISGVGALFSEEFYKFVPRHLNEGGLFMQWVQIYEIDDALLGSVLKSLTPAFDDYGAWLSNGSDLLIVASPKGPLPKMDFSKLAANPKVKADLERVGIANAQQLDFRKVADARMLRALSKITQEPGPNSDYFPILGLHAPKSRFKGASAVTTMSLPKVNRPLLEAMGISPALPDNVPISSLKYFAGDVLTAEARQLASELRGEVAALSPGPAFLRATLGNCTADLTADQIQAASGFISTIGARTVTHLPASALQGVWVNPTWQTCKRLSKDLIRALKILEVHSQRDYPQMEALGIDWIKNRPRNQYSRIEFDGLAWSGIVLSRIHSRRWGELPEAIDLLDKDTAIVNDYSFLANIVNSMGNNNPVAKSN